MMFRLTSVCRCTPQHLMTPAFGRPVVAPHFLLVVAVELVPLVPIQVGRMRHTPSRRIAVDPLSQSPLR